MDQLRRQQIQAALDKKKQSENQSETKQNHSNNPGNVINRKLKRVQKNQKRFEKSECRCSNKAILMALSGITVVSGALGWYYTK